MPLKQAEPPRRATIKDVADASGISIGTISRVMNGHSNVAPNTRERVLRAVALLDYAPDIAAQSLRLGSTKVIGCLIPIASHPVFASVVAAAEQVLRKAGFAMVLGSTTDRVEREADLLGFFRGHRVDGLIAALARDDDPTIAKRLRTLGCPVVLLDRSLEEDFDAVLTDQGQGCLEATRHLLMLGHRRIALVTSSQHSRPGRERVRNFRAAFAELGAEPEDRLIHTINSPTDFALEDGASLLSGPSPPTAVVAGVHELIGLLQGVRARRMSVPRDLSIIAFGDSDLAELADPPISVVRWDAKEVGRLAAKMILHRVGQRSSSLPRQVTLPTELVLRGSCALPPST